jgi:hypothetical protein
VRARLKTGNPLAPSKAPVPKVNAPAPASSKLMAAASSTSAARSSVEDLLRAVASEIGLATAIGLLEEQRQHVLRVLGR